MRGAPLGYLQAREKFKSANLLTAGEQVLKLAVLCALALAHGSVTLRAAVMAVLVSTCVAVAAGGVLLIAAWRKLPAGPVSREPALLREYASFSTNTFLSSTLKAGNQQVDVLALGMMTDATAAGFYGLVRQFAAPLSLLSAPFSAIFYPRFVSAVHEGRTEELRESIRGGGRALLRVFRWAIPAIAVAFFIYTHWIRVELGPREYLVSAIVLLGGFVGAFQWWVRPFANAVNPRLSLLANAGATGVILTTIWPLTHALGVLGTATVMCGVALGLSWFWRQQLARYA
jgi:O-antigen/teichoic acid export membrane protein